MSASPEQGFSPEQQHAYGQITGFFGRAERLFPAAAGRLANLIGGLVGEEQTTQRKLQDGMGNIDVGLALIGDWIKEAGADGFEVKLGLGGGARKAIARKLVPLPNASELISVASMGNPRVQDQIQSLLSIFSMQVWMALDIGLSPRQIVGGLVAESVGSRLSANGSANLREGLNKPLAGHFEWIREALKIPDVAGQPGFREKTAQPAGREEKSSQVKVVPAEEITPAKKELPAFLKGDELPKGYQWVDFPNESEQEVALGEREGSTVVCYIQGLGVRLTRGPRDITYVQLLGIPAPYSISPTENGIPLSEVSFIESERDARPKSLYLETKRDFRPTSIEFENMDWRYVVTIPLQASVRSGGTNFTIPDFGSSGVSFSTYPVEGSRGKIQIRNENLIFGAVDRIAIPSMAIVGPKEQTEVAPPFKETAEESVMMLRLSDLSEIEEGQEKPLDGAALQTLFIRTQGDFSRLPAGSRLRVEMIKSALEQLGETGEKLRKAGKNDEEIFAEWLRQVFLALYRRARWGGNRPRP